MKTTTKEYFIETLGDVINSRSSKLSKRDSAVLIRIVEKLKMIPDEKANDKNILAKILTGLYEFLTRDKLI